MKHPVLSLSLLLSIGLTAFAADRSTTDSTTVYFRQSHINIDTAYMGNGHCLDSVFSRKADRWRLRAVSVSGAASPEGSESFNRYLSRHRAGAIFDTFDSHGFLTDSVSTSFSYLGSDWDGLREMVRLDSLVPSRERVLQLLSLIADGEVSDPLARLKALDGGEPYRYMYHNLFPSLRRSTIVLDYAYPLPEILPPGPLPEPEVTVAPPAFSLPFEIPGRARKPFYMALKTNLLYDAALLPNIGAEFYIGRNWSLTADWMYGWWDRDSSHYYWRAYGGTLGARRWFGRRAKEKPLTGHHLGAFAGIVTYDFELGGTGYMGGRPRGTLWDRRNIICGIEYGYSLPIGRRLNLDFSIALGYLGGKVIKYKPRDHFYEWESVRNFRWFGPTKLEVALVWLIGHGNTNK